MGLFFGIATTDDSGGETTTIVSSLNVDLLSEGKTSVLFYDSFNFELL